MRNLKRLYHFSIAIIVAIAILMVLSSDFSPLHWRFNQHNYIGDANMILFILALDYALRFTSVRWKSLRPKVKNLYHRMRRTPLRRYVVSLRHTSGKVLGLLHTSGFSLLLYVSLAILVISAIIFSLAENTSLAEGLWWAIATATTVGYGDIYPHTLIGKFTAAFLMIGGIGFIGTLTSTISAYVTRDRDEDKSAIILRRLSAIEKQNRDLKKQITRIERKRRHK